MSKQKIYKWGIIGPGKIANKFAVALSRVPGATLWAVASRDEVKAKAFAEKHGAEKHYNTYEAIAADPDIDVIYIATPHTFHHAHTLMCLENKKAVLCEKPMSVNYASTKQMISVARDNNVFLMEALWTRFLPITNKVLELISEGVIGDVKFVKADFGTIFPFNADSRIYNVKLGGGSLLDIGVYPLFLTLLLLGKPDEIKSMAHLAVTGADETMSVSLSYKNGNMASVFSTFAGHTPLTADITGTKGCIFLPVPWYKGSSIIVKTNAGEETNIAVPYGDNGFEFEIEEVNRCLDNGLTESSLLTLDFSLMMSKVVDDISKQCGLTYELQ